MAFVSPSFSHNFLHVQLHITKPVAPWFLNRKPNVDEAFSAPHVARLIGIKTPTLAKRPALEKDPKGWIQSLTEAVTYPRGEVGKFLAEYAAKPRAYA